MTQRTGPATELPEAGSGRSAPDAVASTRPFASVLLTNEDASRAVQNHLLYDECRMSYELSEFLRNRPIHCACVEIDAATATGTGLHLARWPSSAFESLASFVRFQFRHSRVIPPYISEPGRDDLEGWFFADASADSRGDELTASNAPRSEEARDWLARRYPAIAVEWLKSGTQGRIVDLEGGEWPEMIGCDSEGYFCAFAAEMI